ncbi:MAG TPA: hypothetical protein VFU82_08770 [Gammaproteobacteria bacterium]|nr:hypothetical protein [Gammaproteobacteria bacterium]
MPLERITEKEIQAEDLVAWLGSLLSASLPENSEESKKALAALSAPLTGETIEKALPVIVNNDNDHKRKKELLQLIQMHYLQDARHITVPMLAFILQQGRVPELVVSVARLCFTILFRVTVVDLPLPLGSVAYAHMQKFLGGDYFSKVLNVLYQCVTRLESECVILSAILRIEYENSEENPINQLVKIFNEMLKRNQLEDALKILFLLSTSGKYLDEGESAYKECMDLCAVSFKEMVDFYRSRNKPLSTSYELLTILLDRHYRGGESLPIWMAEACLYFSQQSVNARDGVVLAKFLLGFLEEGFKAKRAIQSLPESLPDTVLNCFNFPDDEIRRSTYQTYKAIMLAGDKELRSALLLPKFFSKLRECAQKDDEVLHDFLMTVLDGLEAFQQEKADIVAMIEQTRLLGEFRHVESLTPEMLENALKLTIKNISEPNEIAFKKKQLSLLNVYLQHNTFITEPALDFVLQQCQAPALTSLADQVCFSLLLKVVWVNLPAPADGSSKASAVCFWGREHYSKLLDRLHQCAMNTNKTRMEGVLGLVTKKSQLTALVERFNYALKYPRFDHAIKIILLLAELAAHSKEARLAYQTCSDHYIHSVERMIEIHRAKKMPIPIHRLLMTLFQHHNEKVRIFAAKVILIGVHRSYLITHVDKQADYPFRELRELVTPTLLEKLTDPSIEVRQWVAGSLCYLFVGKQVDPQLLVCYAEELLATNDPLMQKIVLLGLGWFIADYEAVVSQTTILKAIELCQQPNSLSPYFKANALHLLNWQVRRSGFPLPAEMIERSCSVANDASMPADDKAAVAKAWLMMVGTSFEKQEEWLFLSAAVADVMLDCFDIPEVRDRAYYTYMKLIELSTKKVGMRLSVKLFSKFRECARKDDIELQNFVVTYLKKITTIHPEISEILGIVEQTRKTMPLVIGKVEPLTLSTEKDLDALLEELKTLNVNQPKVLALLEDHFLENALAAVKASYKADSGFQSAGKPIEAWSVSDCQAWANSVKANKAKALAQDFQAEIIAVMMRASALDSGHTPRNTQLLVLLLILKLSDNGCLLEVKTSEGKTLITAMFSAMKALQYDYVDVVSSSSVLAKREPRETRNFYAALSLTVAHIIDGKEHDGKAARPCYAANVIYGDTSEYQWDIVREIMREKITRGGRPFRVLFFDEADSLLVDRAERGAMIVNHFPGMEYIKHLIVAVWHMTVRMSQSINKDNEGWFYQPPNGGNKVRFERPHAFVAQVLKKYIVKLMEDPTSPVLVSKTAKRFILLESEEIARAAGWAYYGCQLNRDYVITDNDGWNGKQGKEIAPVDLYLTGEIQKHTRWTYLHPFLELKHSLTMGEPQLMGNYLSTPGLCRLYGNKIFGVTGTLGGADTQALLKEMYGADLVFIPTYKPKCFVEYEGVVAPTKSMWLGVILHQVKQEVEKNRPVLVVAPTIAEVAFLEQELIKANFCRKVTRYSRNDTDENDIPEHDMEAGEVIVATLLAGRGIDWHFPKHQDALIEQAGGLHIIVTSLPPNLRVEQQIFGRTARRGNSGTAQIIVNREDVQHVVKKEDAAYLGDMRNLKLWRDSVEAKRVNNIKVKSIRLALLKDELYTRFRHFIDSIPDNELSKLRIKSIEEQWAFWLQSVFEKLEESFNPDTTFQLIESQFQEFMRSVSGDPEITRKNTFLQVQHGNILNFGTEETRMDFSAAVNIFTKAISDDPIVGVQAYYNRAQAHIFMKREGYKEAMLADLKMAKQNLEQHIIPQLQSMLVVHNLNPWTKDGLSNDFAKETHMKIELLKLEIRNIDENVQVIESSIRRARKKKQKVDFEVTGYQMLHEFFADEASAPHAEINELYESGLMHLFTIEPFFRKKKRSGFGSLCVAFLGIVQIVVGALISYTMPMIGSALIQEGINDLMYAARTLINGDFSWDDYLARKVGSVAITVISMGLDVLKESADLELAAEASKGKNTLENMIKRQLSHKELFERVQREVVTRLIDTGVREVFSFAVDKLTTATMDGFSDEIKRLIVKRLKENLDNLPALNEMLMLQSMGSMQMRNKLVQLSVDVAYEKSNPIQGVANGIIKGVLASQHKDIGTFLKVAEMGMAMDKIVQLADDFTQKFKSKLLYFYHQNTEKFANVIVNSDAIASIKNGFYLRIAMHLTNRIIAIAKGEIIHPAADMAMNEHFSQISEVIKRAALQPVAPQNEMPTPAPEVPVEPKATPTQFKQHLMSKRDDARRETLTKAFEKTAKQPVVPQQASVVVPKPAKKARQPVPPTKKPVVVKAGAVPLQQPTLIRAKGVYPKDAAKVSLVASKPAAVSSEDLLDYLGAVASGGYKGIEKVLRGYAYALGHPFETLGALAKTPYDVGKFLHDAQMVGAKMAPMGQMVNFMDPDFTLLQHLVRQAPSIAAGSVERMSVRERAVINKIQQFLNASGPAKTEMATELLTTFFGPGALAKGAISVVNLRQFGMMTTPPLFHNIGEVNTVVRHNIGFENAITPPGLIKYISPDRARLLNNGNGEYMYAITKNKQLLIGDGRTKIPANWDRAQEMAIFHPELAQLQPVYVAGKFKIVNGELSVIMNNSGHYLPHGPHLKKFTERVFGENGFPEARGKFKPVTTLISPETRAVVSYPPHVNAPKLLTIGSGVTTFLDQQESDDRGRFESSAAVVSLKKNDVVDSHLIENKASLPVFVPENLNAIAFRSRLRMPNTGVPPSSLRRFALNMFAELKPHDSMLGYYLDFMMMYPPMRYLEGATLVGQYSKENELSKKAFQSWGEKLKQGDVFADDSFRAGVALVLLEDLATGFNAAKEFTVTQIKERLVQLEALGKLLAAASASSGFSLFAARTSSDDGFDEVGVLDQTVKIFDVNRGKYDNNRYRLFFRDDLVLSREEKRLAELKYDGVVTTQALISRRKPS